MEPLGGEKRNSWSEDEVTKSDTGYKDEGRNLYEKTKNLGSNRETMF